MCVVPQSSAPNGPEPHCRDLRLRCFRRSGASSGPPGGHGVDSTQWTVIKAVTCGDVSRIDALRMTSCREVWSGACLALGQGVRHAMGVAQLPVRGYP